jgi:predicted AAA+ superfamily ATPase
MSPLSLSEILSRPEIPFKVDFEKNIKRCMEHTMRPEEIYRTVVRGSYPELYDKEQLGTHEFYSDYVDTYLTRDVSRMINLKDKTRFLEFMELTASLTGQELVYNKIANTIGVDIKTIQSWISVLAAGDIIHLVRAYSERSAVKRIVNHPKIYFWDTGLACHLAKVRDADTLRAGYLKGPMTETFIVNEIMKSYRNNKDDAGFYHYRDAQMNEIDLIILRDGTISLIECKAGMTFGPSDVKAFRRLENSDYKIGESCIICMTEKPYPVKEGVYALPITAI